MQTVSALCPRALKEGFWKSIKGEKQTSRIPPFNSTSHFHRDSCCLFLLFLLLVTCNLQFYQQTCLLFPNLAILKGISKLVSEHLTVLCHSHLQPRGDLGYPNVYIRKGTGWELMNTYSPWICKWIKWGLNKLGDCMDLGLNSGLVFKKICAIISW